ncbi:MAG TPA: phasin family protein [Gammaproteobacteria bacterium]|nr:phasin family protein [Gammaproteobacteria bacterium]
MYEDLFGKVNVSMEKYLTPVREFSSLVVDNVEKLVSFQFEAARAYTDMGLKQVREGLAVKDVDGLQSFVSAQQDTAKSVAEKVQSDVKTVADLNQDFGQKVQKLVEKNVKAFSTDTAGATKSATTTKSSTASSAQGTKKTA